MRISSVRWSAITYALALTAALELAGVAGASAQKEEASDRIVPPSEYVDDIETPGTTGGVEDEADAAAAQAEQAPSESVAPQSETLGPGSPAAIAVDLVVARPTMLMATVAGSAFFALSLPITAPSGMYDDALERFVSEPGRRLIGPLGE